MANRTSVCRRQELKLVMTLLVRDEADIVRDNIEFHLSHGVDFVVATDNGSRDETADILAEYERQGTLKLLHQPEHNFAQSDWVTRMAFLARDHYGADWILNNDADEFWWPLHGDLKHELHSATQGVLNCQRQNMLYAFDTETDDPWYRRLIYAASDQQPLPPANTAPRDRLPDPLYYYRLRQKVLASADGLTRVGMGNHAVKHESPVPEYASRIRIYHFPVRSRAHLRRKIINGGEAVARNTDLPVKTASHWRRWHSDLSQHNDIDRIMTQILPDTGRLQGDIAAGRLVEDPTLADCLSALRSTR